MGSSQFPLPVNTPNIENFKTLQYRIRSLRLSFPYPTQKQQLSQAKPAVCEELLSQRYFSDIARSISSDTSQPTVSTPLMTNSEMVPQGTKSPLDRDTSAPGTVFPTLLALSPRR